MAKIAEMLELEVNQYNQLQKELTKLGATRTQLDSQLNENELVKKEFELLKDDSEIYKLIGPVLVKQEKIEASANVNKRIEYISAEIKRTEKLIEEIEEKQEKKRLEQYQASIEGKAS
ncbi:prefoldin subunit 6-like protein [Cladochytrium replicatum]|nr:prefoldin subunit 6-like protein [Cladochytrium replicatum]